MSTAARLAPPNKWLVTLSVSFGTLMGSIDASIINVALPQIRGSLGATLQESTWASTSFIIAMVVVLPLTGFVGRLFGQKRAYLGCLALFIVSSLLCGLAWSLPSLVIFRAIQGLGAGALTPIEQSILRQTFPPEEQGMAMAVFTMVVVVGPTLGPTLGGYIVDNWHWSWVFLINLPLGSIGFLLVWHFVEESEEVRKAHRVAAESQRRHLDWSGIALMCVGLATLQYVLEEGQSQDWFESRKITVIALVAGLSLVAFVLRERNARVPAVDLSVFKDPVFSSGVVIGTLIFFIIIAEMFLLSLFMQEVLGFTATQTGMALAPRTLVMVMTMPIIGRLYGRVSPRWLLGAGLVFTCMGVYRISGLTLDTSTSDIVLALVLQGVGASLTFVPLNTMLFDNIPQKHMADAAGVNLMLRHVGSSLGLALFASLVPRYVTQASAALSSHVTAERPEAVAHLTQLRNGLIARGLDEVGAHEASLRLMADTVMRESMVIAFNRLFHLSALLFLATLPLLLFLNPSRRPATRAHVALEEV